MPMHTIAEREKEDNGTSFHEHANEVLNERALKSNTEFGFTGINDTTQEGPKDMGGDGLSTKMRPAGIQ